MTRIGWLRQLPLRTTPNGVLAEIDKLVFLREIGVESWDLSALPPKRAATMARWASAASNQALAQSSEERRYPAIVAFCAHRLVEITDGIVYLFDRLLSEVNATARRRHGERQQAAASANRQRATPPDAGLDGLLLPRRGHEREGRCWTLTLPRTGEAAGRR